MATRPATQPATQPVQPAKSIDSDWEPIVTPSPQSDDWETVAPMSQTSNPKSFTDQLKDIGKGFWGQLTQTGEGMVNLATSPVQSAKSYLQSNESLANKAGDAYNKGDYLEAIRHGINYVINGIPGVGQQIDTSGTKAQQGSWGEATGESIALGGQLAAGSLASQMAPKSAPAPPTALDTATGPKPVISPSRGNVPTLPSRLTQTIAAHPGAARTIGGVIGYGAGEVARETLGIPGAAGWESRIAGAALGRYAGRVLANRAKQSVGDSTITPYIEPPAPTGSALGFDLQSGLTPDDLTNVASARTVPPRTAPGIGGPNIQPNPIDTESVASASPSPASQGRPVDFAQAAGAPKRTLPNRTRAASPSPPAAAPSTNHQPPAPADMTPAEPPPDTASIQPPVAAGDDIPTEPSPSRPDPLANDPGTQAWLGNQRILAGNIAHYLRSKGLGYSDIKQMETEDPTAFKSLQAEASKLGKGKNYNAAIPSRQGWPSTWDRAVDENLHPDYETASQASFRMYSKRTQAQASQAQGATPNVDDQIYESIRSGAAAPAGATGGVDSLGHPLPNNIPGIIRANPKIPPDQIHQSLLRQSDPNSSNQRLALKEANDQATASQNPALYTQDPVTKRYYSGVSLRQ